MQALITGCMKRHWHRLDNRPQIVCNLLVPGDGPVILRIAILADCVSLDMADFVCHKSLSIQERRLADAQCNPDNDRFFRFAGYSVIIGFVSGPNASQTAEIMIARTSQLERKSDTWNLSVPPDDQLVPAYKGHSIVPHAVDSTIRIKCNLPCDEHPRAVLGWFATKASAEILYLRRADFGRLPDLYQKIIVARKRDERLTLHKELVELVWHPNRVNDKLVPEAIFEEI